MTLFDTHAHFEGAAAATAATLVRAAAADVTRLVAVGGSVELNAGVERAAEEGPAAGVRVWRALGWDRDQAGKGDLPPLDFAGVAAVGEIGLDYHYEGPSRREQLDLFEQQLEAAHDRDLPVIIHTREADDDTLGALREIGAQGVIHCFTGTPAFAKKLLDLGFFISISGIVTFRAADNVRESALVIPDDRLLIETDSPFLAPVPMRGNPNEPAFIVHTAKFLADLRRTAPEVLAETTTANALALFGA